MTHISTATIMILKLTSPILRTRIRNMGPPGCFDHTTSSGYKFSPSPDCYSQGHLGALSHCQKEITRLLQLSESEENRPDDEFPASFIRYMIEWKVKVNNRLAAQDAEQDVALSPSAYWSLVLKNKLDNLLERKISHRRRVRSDDASTVVSVNNRTQRDLTKGI